MSEPIKTALCFLIDEDENILLLERKNTWFENGKYCPPGGLVDEGETVEESCVREVHEETGLLVLLEDIELIKEFYTDGDSKCWHNHYFKTSVFKGNVKNNEPDRHSNVGWFPLSKLPTNTSKLVYDTIKELCQI